MIEDFDVIFYTTAFIVPGYILYSTLEYLVPRTKSDLIDSSLKFLTATLIHYILWSFLIFQMFNNQWYSERPFLFYILSILIIIISPCLIGLFIVQINKMNISTKILQFLGFSPINPIPTSWDYVFYNIQKTSWVIVNLKNGKSFFGKFSAESFASSNLESNDLFIEDVYTLNSDNSWVKRERNNGVLILNDEIESIEFFDDI